MAQRLVADAVPALQGAFAQVDGRGPGASGPKALGNAPLPTQAFTTR